MNPRRCDPMLEIIRSTRMIRVGCMPLSGRGERNLSSIR